MKKSKPETVLREKLPWLEAILNTKGRKPLSSFLTEPGVSHSVDHVIIIK